MAEEIAATIEPYVLNGTDEDLKRLLKISELVAEFARTAYRGPAYGQVGPQLSARPRPSFPKVELGPLTTEGAIAEMSVCPCALLIVLR